ncbi:MAG: hypothetical protein QME42_01045 [bacterium]|nr:hypothetical protein [bacterium]
MNRKGVTLIEAVIGFAGLGIFLLMVYTLLMGGIQNWTTINPQLTARQICREILNGKTGEEWGGLVGEINACNIRIATSTPTGTLTNFTTLNFQTRYGTGSIVGTVAICYAWQGVGTTTPPYYPLDRSVSQIGTLTKTVWRQQIIGTTTTWEIIPTKTLTLATNIRIGSSTYGTITAYPLFKYYTGLGVEKYDNPDTPAVNELLDAINANQIRQIGINMVFDIDTDKDGKFGEDPLGNGNQDNDRKVDEDKPADFSINTKVAGMNLNL